jgi:hypothetical protein
MQTRLTEQNITSGTATEAALPPTARPTSGMNPLHSQTESTLAPTSEFVRLFLLGWTVRYIFRGAGRELFDSAAVRFISKPVGRLVEWLGARSGRQLTKAMHTATEEIDALRGAVNRARDNSTVISGWFDSAESAAHGLNAEEWKAAQSFYQKLRPALKSWRASGDEAAYLLKTQLNESRVGAEDMFRPIRNSLSNMAYGLSLGISSVVLSLTYSRMVRSDIRNMFSEVVAYEKGISPDQVKFSDIAASNNHIIQRTVHNYRIKLAQRLGTDALFFATTPFKSEGIIDIVLGVKGTQIFAETWKRKPTLFEDIVTLVNNKINPRNGLGQQVTVGEVFDLYQHYTEQFAPNKMFHNVLERGSGEGEIWAKSEPIFQRITELMNLTYAYKHPTVLDASGQAIAQANFPLPKLIYLLGHGLIDPREPERTMAYIEIANRYGMEEVRALEEGLRKGVALETLLVKYPAAHIATRVATPIAADPINSITKVNHPHHAPPAESPRPTIDAGSGELLSGRAATAPAL